MAMEFTRSRQSVYLLRVQRTLSYRLYLAAKRIMDVLISSIALVLVAPLMLVVGLAIKLDSPGPVLFKQRRVKGLKPDGKPVLFTFYKFRSMANRADSSVHQKYMSDFINGNGTLYKDGNGKAVYKLASDRRVTRIGRILRKTSLDELPQLINVIKGDMSMVGPRPAIPYEVEQYKEWHKRRLVVTPGITGLWQVKGRSSVTFDEMVRWDIEYAEDRSLRMDLRILFQTVPAVLSGKGAA
jgi:lipopolysaccharide/colanic/teichoic acid biosynthesis glycosyltransferase